jgi:hypothetical protein
MINLNDDAILGSKEKYSVTEETEFLESYFRAGLDNTSELSDEYTQISSDLYTSLKESVSNSISAFTSFYNSCKNIFATYINKLNSNMYNQYSSAFKRKIREDRNAIEKYKKKLMNYSGKDLDITVTRYEYSVFDENIPKLKLFESYKDKREQTNAILVSSGDETKKKLITAEFNEIKTYITSGECYNNARASILGLDYPVEAKDYAKAIFDVYRSGGDQIVEYSISASQIREIVKRFYAYDQYIDNLDKQKRKLFKQYTYILDHLTNYDMYQIKNLTYDDEILMQYNLYIKLKTDQLMHYCSLYVAAYDGKLDALINSYMQDRDIILKVCGYLTADEERKEEE